MSSARELVLKVYVYVDEGHQFGFLCLFLIHVLLFIGFVGVACSELDPARLRPAPSILPPV